LRCNFGLCCIGIPSACSDMHVCNAYNPCHSVWRDYENAKKGSDSNKRAGANTISLRSASWNLEDLCSDESLTTPDGQDACEKECDYAICCVGVGGDCRNQKNVCDSYSPCDAIWGQMQYNDDHQAPTLIGQGASSPKSGLASIQNKHENDKKLAETIIKSAVDSGTTMPPAGLEDSCTSNVDSDAFDGCLKLCKTASCCFVKGPGRCFSTKVDYCYAWAFCSVVFEHFFEIDLASTN